MPTTLTTDALPVLGSFLIDPIQMDPLPPVYALVLDSQDHSAFTTWGRPTTVDAEGRPYHLIEELGPGSVARIRAVRARSGMWLMVAVQVLIHLRPRPLF